MSAPSIDRRQGHTRIAFTQAVQLRVSGHPVVARTLNLSERGVFVAAPQTLPPGTELACDVPLRDTAVSVRGRVAWVDDADRAGMGIEFLDLSELDLSQLRQAVMEGEPLSWRRDARIWFEGVAHPTCAQAVMTAHGAILSSDLGFLRLRSPVVLSFTDEEGESYAGSLQEVWLRTGPNQEVPQLQLAIELDHLASETWTHWPPLALREQQSKPTSGCPAGSPGTGHPLEEPEPPAMTIAELGASEDDDAFDVVLEPATPDAGEPVFDLRPPDRRATSGSITAREQLGPTLPALPLVSVQTDPELLDVLAEDPYHLPPRDPRDTSDWRLDVRVADPSHWTLRVDALPAPTRRRRRSHLWLWLLAGLMTGVTVASMSYTDLWPRVRDRLISWFRGRPALVRWSDPAVPVIVGPWRTPARDPATIAAAASRPAAATKPALAPTTTTTTTTTTTPAERSAGATSRDGAAPHLETSGRQTTVAVPISGSLEGATHYPLASPAGLAINLPHAAPLIPHGDYVLQRGGLRVVWVRRRVGGGVHLRFLFANPAVAPRLQLTKGAVQVVLTRAASTSSPVPAPAAAGDDATSGE